MGCNCTKVPPPADNYKDAIGTWKGLNEDGATITFVLYGDGSFFWRRETGSTSISKRGPINGWSGNTFESKPCCCCSWHFEIMPPVHNGDGDGKLTMEVNGVTLAYNGLPVSFKSQ
jgi:hypothetical protein